MYMMLQCITSCTVCEDIKKNKHSFEEFDSQEPDLEHLLSLIIQDFRVTAISLKVKIDKHTYCCKEFFVHRDSSNINFDNFYNVLFK